MSFDNIIKKFYEFHNSLKLYHWTTDKFNEHKTVGKLYDKLAPMIDDFVENYIANYGKQEIESKTEVSLKIENINYTDQIDIDQISSISYDLYTEIGNSKSSKLIEYIKDFTKFLKTDLTESLRKDDYDLLAIRDNMISVTNKHIYLLSMY
jgi:hypothetical protein